MSKNVAVLLAGCGYLDGAEIREAVLTLLNLDISAANVSIFAPDRVQHHVVDHSQGSEAKEERNIFIESARIARGKIQKLSDLNVDNFDALVMPGGFGVAKNLCTFAFEGSAGRVDDLVREKIVAFYDQKKPIGAICISPALVALCLGDKGVKLTIGNDKETASEIEKLGAKHVECPVDNCVVDTDHKVVSTPAYMYDDANLDAINSGISKCIREVLAF